MDPLGRERMPALSRRQMLSRVANGFGLLALGGLLAEEARGSSSTSGAEALALRRLHHPARARRVIFLFMDGGPSQVDLFDPKPPLTRDHGKPRPFEKPKLARTTTENLMASPFRFRRCGRSGPGVASCRRKPAPSSTAACVTPRLPATNSNHPTPCRK